LTVEEARHVRFYRENADKIKAQRNQPERRAARLAAAAERNLRFRAFLARWKLAAGCADCGYAAHPAALDFDHVRGEKSFNICDGGTRRHAVLLAELEKCVVRCANCHRIATHERR
jgi:hypothetical protein